MQNSCRSWRWWFFSLIETMVFFYYPIPGWTSATFSTQFAKRQGCQLYWHYINQRVSLPTKERFNSNNNLITLPTFIHSNPLLDKKKQITMTWTSTKKPLSRNKTAKTSPGFTGACGFRGKLLETQRAADSMLKRWCEGAGHSCPELPRLTKMLTVLAWRQYLLMLQKSSLKTRTSWGW